MLARRFVKSVFNTLPPAVQQRVQDTVEESHRRHPVPHRGLDEFGLAGTQVYPEGTNFDDCVRAGMMNQLNGLIIDRETPVASIGSCFADEFATHMRATGFNYVSAEPDVFPASANWGRVYTIPCLHQIARYSVDQDFAMPIERFADGWFDPLREPRAGLFATRKEAEEAIRSHRGASRQVFARAQLLVITLGQNEAWIDHESGMVWAHRPPPSLLKPDCGRFEGEDFLIRRRRRMAGRLSAASARIAFPLKPLCGMPSPAFP